MAGPLSTAACELIGAAKAGLLVNCIGLLDETEIDETGGLEDDSVLGVAGADGEGAGCGVGVKYDVDNTVSAVWVAIGSPFGLRKVTAGIT